MDTDAIMEAVYRVLRRYQDGKIKPGSIAVGILTAELSAVFLEIEKAVKSAATPEAAPCH